MWIIKKVLFTLCVTLVSPSVFALAPAQERAFIAAFDTAFEQVYTHYQLPGLAIGVVVDGEIIYKRTAGEVRAGSGEPINADTLFKIASNSKAMTAGVLARLVDQGKLAWTDPVTTHLPHFRMSDPWVTQHMQVRDLLIHSGGLPSGAGDMMLWPENSRYKPADILAKVTQLKPAYSFRSRYAYDNLLYVVAGEVASAAGGKPLDQLLRTELFEPLGLSRCQAGSWQRDTVGNVAQPHTRQRGRNVLVRQDAAQIPYSPGLAAGDIRCSLNDMLTWIQRAWLVPDSDNPWLSPAQRRTVWTLATPMPISNRMRQWDNTHLHGYGYGWRLSDVDGHWKVAHTGTLTGMYSAVVLLPDLRSGFVILINGSAAQARTALTQALLKRFTRPEASHLNAAYYMATLETTHSAIDSIAQHTQLPHFSQIQVGSDNDDILDEEIFSPLDRAFSEY